MSLALASASAFSVRAAASCAFRSPSCWADSVVLFGPTRRLDLGAERLDLGFGLLDLFAHRFRSRRRARRRRRAPAPAWPAAGAQIGVGDGVGDARGEFGIFRQKIDDDDARFFHRVDVEPVVIGFEHALFRRHAHRVFDEAEEAEHALDQRDAAERRIELGQLVELELGDHFGGEIARQNELHLAGHRFRIDHAAVDDILVGVGAQEHVVAADHEHARFGRYFGGIIITTANVINATDDGRAQDLAALAPERRAELGRSKSASIICPRNGGRGGCDAKLISRLLLTDSGATNAGPVRSP